MPLSEYEQRVLEQMEQQLRSDDPKLAQAISGRGPRSPLNVALGVVLVLAGLGMLVGGVASTHYWWLGILGFVAMFGGVLLFLHRPSLKGVEPARSNVRPLKKPRRGFMDNLENRWDRRRDQGR